MVKDTPSLRETILDAAVTLLRTSGVKKLAQPQVARAAGVPQGHLTYYFPKKIDLLAAIAKRFVEMAQMDLHEFTSARGWRRASSTARDGALRFVKSLAADRERTRMLLGLLVEADEEPELRRAMNEGARFARSTLAHVVDRSPDDPQVELLLATLWGLGIQHYLRGDSEESSAHLDTMLEQVSLLFAKAAPSVAPPPPPEAPRAASEGPSRTSAQTTYAASKTAPSEPPQNPRKER
jgi:AcrR family transcriptional regulator